MRNTMTISDIMHAWVRKGIMCENNRPSRQSGVYAMYYTLRKGAGLRGPQTNSEMRGSKSLGFWGRGGPGGGGGGRGGGRRGAFHWGDLYRSYKLLQPHLIQQHPLPLPKFFWISACPAAQHAYYPVIRTAIL